MKYTKGKWVTRTRNGKAELAYLQGVNCNSKKLPLDFIEESWADDLNKEVQANRSLIESAPEMLEVLCRNKWC